MGEPVYKLFVESIPNNGDSSQHNVRVLRCLFRVIQILIHIVIDLVVPWNLVVLGFKPSALEVHLFCRDDTYRQKKAVTGLLQEFCIVIQIFSSLFSNRRKRARVTQIEQKIITANESPVRPAVITSMARHSDHFVRALKNALASHRRFGNVDI